MVYDAPHTRVQGVRRHVRVPRRPQRDRPDVARQARLGAVGHGQQLPVLQRQRQRPAEALEEVAAQALLHVALEVACHGIAEH